MSDRTDEYDAVARENKKLRATLKETLEQQMAIAVEYEQVVLGLKEENDRRERIILRMTPLLREHYTEEYIRWELFGGDE